MRAQRLPLPRVIVAIVLANAACAAHYQGRVTLEDEYTPDPEVSAAAATTPSRYGTRRPVCNGDLPMPDYPPELLGPEAPVVRVRVDFLLNNEGVPEEILAGFQPDGERPGPPSDADPRAQPRTNLERGTDQPTTSEREIEGLSLFLEAAEAAISQWRCQPAWRPPLPNEPPRWIPLPYRTWIVFRFDAERVDRKAALERKS